MLEYFNDAETFTENSPIGQCKSRPIIILLNSLRSFGDVNVRGYLKVDLVKGV